MCASNLAPLGEQAYVYIANVYIAKCASSRLALYSGDGTLHRGDGGSQIGVGVATAMS